MTEKQEKILQAALKLFAQEGFASTSTSKVAKAAEVSEGLIFRHFKNKEGLLMAIMNQAKESTKLLLADIIMTPDPKMMIQKVIELPFLIEPKDYEMWRLTYALKWQTNQYDGSSQEPLKLALTNAFKKLAYTNPEAETELIFMFIDGAATSILLHEPENKLEVLEALKNKYKL
jgi:AcrR family transcriptional regulator